MAFFLRGSVSKRPTRRRPAWILAQLMVLCVAQWAVLHGHCAGIHNSGSYSASASNTPRGSRSSGPRAPSCLPKTLRVVLYLRGGQPQEGGTAVQGFLARCDLSAHAGVFEREGIQVRIRTFTLDPARCHSEPHALLLPSDASPCQKFLLCFYSRAPRSTTKRVHPGSATYNS